MKEYKTLQEVYDAIKSGELDESKISIYMDNDCSSIMYNGFNLYESDAGYDAEELWPVLFPKAYLDKV